MNQADHDANIAALEWIEAFDRGSPDLYIRLMRLDGEWEATLMEVADDPATPDEELDSSDFHPQLWGAVEQLRQLIEESE